MEIRHRNKNGRLFSPCRFSNNVLVSISFIVAVCSALAFVLIFQSPSNEDVIVGNNDGKSSFLSSNDSNYNSGGNKEKNNEKSVGFGIPVFYPRHSESIQTADIITSSVTAKLLEDLRNSALVKEVVALDVENPPAFIENCGVTVVDKTNAKGNSSKNTVERLEVLKHSKQPHLAMELLKYGLERVTCSFDINANAITNMACLLQPTQGCHKH